MNWYLLGICAVVGMMAAIVIWFGYMLSDIWIYSRRRRTEKKIWQIERQKFADGSEKFIAYRYHTVTGLRSLMATFYTLADAEKYIASQIMVSSEIVAPSALADMGEKE